MRITTVRYGFTFNRPNYQSERIDLEAAIDPGESAAEVYYMLKQSVHSLGGDERQAEAAQVAVAAIRADRESGKVRITDSPLQYPDPTTHG